MSLRRHWESVHSRQSPEDASWYQAEPRLSLALIESAASGPDARIIDVGGGASVLAASLLDAGFDHVGVLDISSSALRASQEALGDASSKVEWIRADVLGYEGAHGWDVWHDRAVFHFLVDPADRLRYRDAVYGAVAQGGQVIVATFSPEGPDRCSGLDTIRCSAEDIARELGPDVRLLDARTEEHVTPSGVAQAFTYARLLRVAPGA
jgi:2-polyprenyl-3-methyl-5-hydroxy-6-metoxy-1,4-benzoquinol methylase